MVKSGTERSDKYDAKYDAEVVRSRFDKTATLAKAKAATQQQNMATVAGQIRGILNDAGIYPIMSVLYISFGNALYSIVEKFGGGYGSQVYSLTARNTALLSIAKWKDMGATDQPLKDIWDLFATALGSAPSPIP